MGDAFDKMTKAELKQRMLDRSTAAFEAHQMIVELREFKREAEVLAALYGYERDELRRQLVILAVREIERSLAAGELLEMLTLVYPGRTVDEIRVGFGPPLDRLVKS